MPVHALYTCIYILQRVYIYIVPSMLGNSACSSMAPRGREFGHPIAPNRSWLQHHKIQQWVQVIYHIGEKPLWFRNPNLSNPHLSAYLFSSTLAIGPIPATPIVPKHWKSHQPDPASMRQRPAEVKLLRICWWKQHEKPLMILLPVFSTKEWCMKDLLAENCCKISKMMCQWTWPTVSNGPLMRSPLALKDTLLGWKKVDPFPHLWKPNSMFQNLKVQPILIIHLW